MRFFSVLITIFLCFLFPVPLSGLDYKTGIKLKAPQLMNLTGVAWYNGSDYSLGIGSSGTFVGQFPFCFRVGNLSETGVSSLMNNPVLSQVTGPFSIPDKNISGLTAALPSGSVFSKPFSAFSSFSVKLPNKMEAGVSSFYTVEEKVILNSYISSVPFKNCFFDFGFSFGTSFCEEKEEDSWYMDNPVYKEEYRMFSGVFQSGLRKGSAGLVFSDVFFWGRFGNFFQIYKIDGIFKNGGFSLSYNPDHNVMSLSGKKINESLSIKGNVQKQIKTGGKIPFLWKGGITVLSQMNLSENEDILKIAAGLRMFCVLTSVNNSLQCDFSVPYENDIPKSISLEKVSLGITNSWYFSRIQPVIKFKGWYSPGKSANLSQTGEDVSFSFFLSTKPALGFNAGIELKQKIFLYSGGKGDFGLSLKFKSRYVDVSGKINMSIEF